MIQGWGWSVRLVHPKLKTELNLAESEGCQYQAGYILCIMLDIPWPIVALISI